MAETIVQNFNGQQRDIPRQLTRYAPISPQECIGRASDQLRLGDALNQSSKVVLVNGLGGIGKTTLAKAWLQPVLPRYKHFAWIEVRGNDDKSIATFVETVAYHPDLAQNLQLSFAEKEPPESRFREIMNALRQLEGPNLLVIDNAGLDMNQKEIREQLPLPPSWQVLLTARSRLHGYEAVLLDKLKPDDAARLFRQHFTGECPNEALDALLQEIDCHTLTVELLAKTLQNHLGSLSIVEMTAKLRRRELADDALQRRIELNHSEEETAVYVHLLSSFDVAGLGAEERLLLARLAALPPGGAYAAASLEEWMQIPEAERPAMQETLLGLERKGWLTMNADHSFTLHRMIQQAVLYQLQPGLEALGVLVDSFAEKLYADVSTN